MGPDAATKQLFVLRHAKSSWDDPGARGPRRPLAPRGQRACKVMAEHLRANAIRPELVLCSTRAPHARDARGRGRPGQACDRVRRSTRDHTETRRPPPPGARRVGSVMLIGHNPSIQMLALRLARSGRRMPASGAALERKVPDRRAGDADVRMRLERVRGRDEPGWRRSWTPKELNGKSGAGAAAPARRASTAAR